MSGVTDRIKESVKALDQKQVKKALLLTTKRGLERHHGIVEDAARTCLLFRGKDDQSGCDAAIKVARDKLQETITAPLDTTDLDGLEDLLTPSQQKQEEPVEQPKSMDEMSDEELYKSCDECHVADAVVKFVHISQNACAAEAGQALEPLLQNENTSPEKWVQTMREVASKEGCGQEAYKEVLGTLEVYLKEKDSEILKKANEEAPNG